jgi:hypothetical protein
MALNLGGLTRAFLYTTQVAQEFIRAKSLDSDGGRVVTPAEMVAITAKVACCWATADGVALKINESRLLEVFEQAGWEVIRDSERESSGAKTTITRSK